MIVTASPAILSEDQALSLLEKVVKQSEAEAVFVSLYTGEESLSRFSENQISQNISKTVFSLNITSYFGNKSASAAVTDFDEDAIASSTGLRACSQSNGDRRELNCWMGGVLPSWCRRWRIGKTATSMTCWQSWAIG